MTTVLIHGNPATDAIWTDLVCELTDRSVTDLVLLSPPGFGASIPDGWGATQLESRDWLIAELEDLTSGGNPVDLVGHDWGAGHVFGVLAARPDLVHSWACACTGLVHPDYQWHDLAPLCQTPHVRQQALDGKGDVSR